MQTAAQQEEATRLREQVESLKKMLGERDAQIERQRIQIENLTQAVLHARKKMYGPSSEAAQVTGARAYAESASGRCALRNALFP